MVCTSTMRACCHDVSAAQIPEVGKTRTLRRKKLGMKRTKQVINGDGGQFVTAE